jgi:hypothetical protein
MQLYISEFRLSNVGKLITNNCEIRVLCLTDHRTSFNAAVQIFNFYQTWSTLKLSMVHKYVNAYCAVFKPNSWCLALELPLQEWLEKKVLISTV